jgi:hypothetical protein
VVFFRRYHTAGRTEGSGARQRRDHTDNYPNNTEWSRAGNRTFVLPPCVSCAVFFEMDPRAQSSSSVATVTPRVTGHVRKRSVSASSLIQIPINRQALLDTASLVTIIFLCKKKKHASHHKEEREYETERRGATEEGERETQNRAAGGQDSHIYGRRTPWCGGHSRSQRLPLVE